MTAPSEAARIRVLIADDHGLMRAGLRSLLRDQPDMQVVGEAADGSQALQLAQQFQPDVVLADISMPPPDGIEVARQLKSRVGCCRTLIVSMHEDLRMVQDALDAGAAGYIIKRAVETELIAAIHTVARGQVYIHKDLEALRQASRAPQTELATTGSPAAGSTASAASDLNEMEAKLLRLLADGATMQRVATVLGVDVEQAQRLRKELMGRLGLRSRVDIVRFVDENDIEGS